MRTLIVKLLVNSLVIFLVGTYMKGIHVPDFMTALFVALVLGVANLIIRPILVLITLPINIITLGLFTFIINGALFYAVTLFVKGFTVDSFWWAVLGALVVSVVSTIGNRFFLGSDGKVGGE